MADDFTDRYNTPLSAKDEAAFGAWLQERGKAEGRDLSKDLFDYDLRGAWKDGAAKSENGHLPDTFKKPNHPTFSDESKYSGVDGNTGGKWKQLDGGKWEFAPSQTNLRNMPAGELEAYLKRADPDVTLRLPDAPKSTPELMFPTMMGPP